MFMLISKAVLNYDTFLKKYFKKDIAKDDNLIILPVGMKLPFDPVDYLKQDYGKAHNDLVNCVIKSVSELHDDGIEDSMVVGFNLVTDRVRDTNNADIIATLSSDPAAVALRKGLRITNDPNAPAFRVEPDVPPLRYADLRRKVKEQKPDIKFGKTFNKAMQIIKSDPMLCQVRYLDSNKKTGTKKEFYMNQAVSALLLKYEELETK